MSKKNFKPPSLSFTEILEEWVKFQNLDKKEKYKKAKTLIFNISQVQNLDALSSSQINELLFVIRKTKPYILSGYSNIGKVVASFTVKYLQAAGLNEPAIIFKKRKHLNTEAACFKISDVLNSNQEYVSTKALCELINQKQAFFFYTGADGLFKVTLMLVECQEPILPLKMLKKIHNCSDIAIIECPSGELAVWEDFSDNPQLKITIPAGNYKVAVFSTISNEDLEFFVVLAKTIDSNANSFNDIPDLQ